MSNVMKYKGYVGSMEVDVDAGVCHGRLLFIRDVISYSAESPKDLKAAFEEAVDDYLETAEEMGRKAEAPCSGTFNVRIPPELHMAANLMARSEGVKLNALVKDAISARVGTQTIRHEHAHTMVVEMADGWKDVETITFINRETAAWSH